jgi:ribonucleoside-diphosphate reductase alpha chain
MLPARLLLYSLRKQIFGKLWDHPHIFQHTKKGVEKQIYDSEILSLVYKKDFDRMENWINHMKEIMISHMLVYRQVIDKYLVQDRSTGEGI